MNITNDQENENEKSTTASRKRTQLEADYPSLTSPRSKGQVIGHKKNFEVEDVVNEEMYEEDSPKNTHRKHVNNYTDEIPNVSKVIMDSVRGIKSLQLDTIPKLTSDFDYQKLGASPRPTLDTVVETQEDDKTEIKPQLIPQSPRIKIPTDFLEDACITHTSPRAHFHTIAYHSGKKYQTENESIAEDTNENLIEKDLPRKKNSFHKFEAFIDKEEPPNKGEISEEGEDFEPIKEETVEEDVILQHKNPKKENLCADEVDVGIEMTAMAIPSVKVAIVEEEEIKEIDEEKCGD